MAQQLKALSALSEDLGLIPNTHIFYPSSQPSIIFDPGNLMPFLVSALNTHVHKLQINS